MTTATTTATTAATTTQMMMTTQSNQSNGLIDSSPLEGESLVTIEQVHPQEVEDKLMEDEGGLNEVQLAGRSPLELDDEREAGEGNIEEEGEEIDDGDEDEDEEDEDVEN